MTWAYDTAAEGTTTPTFAGLVEFNGVRINDGAFKSEHLAGLIDMPDIRGDVIPFPSDHGGYDGVPFYGPRAIQIDGWAKAGTVEDVLTATEYLRGLLTLGDGTLKTLVCKRRGWSTRRQCDVRVAGAVSFGEPELKQKVTPTRGFSIPLIAPDPLLYDADNLRTIDVPFNGTPVAVTNNGTAAAPFVARFIGPWDTIANLDAPSIGLFGSEIVYNQGAVAGAWIEMDTHPQARSVIANDGTNHYFNQGDWTLLAIPPGTTNFTATASGTTGASKVTLTWRDAWV